MTSTEDIEHIERALAGNGLPCIAENASDLWPSWDRRWRTLKTLAISTSWGISPDDWRKNTPGSPHHDVDSVILRGPLSLKLEHVFDDVDSWWYVDADAHRRGGILEYRWLEGMAAVALLAHHRGWDLGRVMLCRLNPGGRIDPHIDEGAYSRAHRRLHFVIGAGPGSLTTVGSQTLHLPPGTVWAFDHQQLHSAHNDDPKPRVHLIVDIRRPGH